jgi:hypothetical protein
MFPFNMPAASQARLDDLHRQAHRAALRRAARRAGHAQQQARRRQPGYLMPGLLAAVVCWARRPGLIKSLRAELD